MQYHCYLSSRRICRNLCFRFICTRFLYHPGPVFCSLTVTLLYCALFYEFEERFVMVSSAPFPVMAFATRTPPPNLNAPFRPPSLSFDLMHVTTGSSPLPPIPDEVKDIVSEFVLKVDQYRNVMEILGGQMDKGLKKATHPTAAVKMFPSYVTKLPSGHETGQYLALDLGGTNYRVLLVTLEGSGKPPRMSETVYAIPKDIMVGTGEALFDYIASTLEDFLKKLGVSDTFLPLGFTFSFPCVQQGIDVAKLVRWTKGFSAAGVEGKDVCAFLNAAIQKRNMKVKCIAVINDTVGTLTACALQDPKCAIGLIVGTGTNAAYIEEVKKVETFNGSSKDPSVVINMEWGAFGDDGALEPFLNEFDKRLDKESLNPGKQIFEKMISGMYLGELVRLVLLKLHEKGLLFKGHDVPILKEHGVVHTKYLTETERDPVHLFYSTNYMLTEDMRIPVVQPTDCHIVRYVCERVAARAAFLAGAGIACILNRLNRPEVTVGIDGSLFKFHPKFPERMIDMIHRLKKNDGQFVLRLSEDGSGKGAAAIAAAAATASARS